MQGVRIVRHKHSNYDARLRKQFLLLHFRRQNEREQTLATTVAAPEPPPAYFTRLRLHTTHVDKYAVSLTLGAHAQRG